MSPDAAPTIISDPSAGSFHPELVKGSGPRLATETQALLRGRLRAAGTVLTGTWLLALFRTLLVPGVGVAPGQLLGLVLAGRLTALIHLKPVFSLRQLRSLELGLIFSSAITGGFLQFSDLARLGDAGKVELLTAHLGQSAVLYIWLMLLYGMFIPNTWQRAARVVGAIALVPVGVRLALRLHNPALSELFSADQVSFNVLVLVVSGVSAIYGTHVINSLRQEAHQARKLGQYHLVARIGKGGMGEVWRASHKMLARPAAVKLIRPEMLGGQDSSEDAYHIAAIRAGGESDGWAQVPALDRDLRLWYYRRRNLLLRHGIARRAGSGVLRVPLWSGLPGQSDSHSCAVL